MARFFVFFVIVYSLYSRITRYVSKTTLEIAKANLIPLCVKRTLSCKGNPSVLKATLMSSHVLKAESHPQPSHPPRLRRLRSAYSRFSTLLSTQMAQSIYTHGTDKPANPAVLTMSSHSKSRYKSSTPDTTDSPGTPAYSSALSTRLCHHASVRCSRRVHDTAVLSHPRAQRGVTVASCGSRRDRPSASRARM